jgi:hypothetical protein
VDASTSTRMGGRAISSDILEFRARVLVIHAQASATGERVVRQRFWLSTRASRLFRAVTFRRTGGAQFGVVGGRCSRGLWSAKYSVSPKFRQEIRPLRTDLRLVTDEAAYMPR